MASVSQSPVQVHTSMLTITVSGYNTFGPSTSATLMIWLWIVISSTPIQYGPLSQYLRSSLLIPHHSPLSPKVWLRLSYTVPKFLQSDPGLPVPIHMEWRFVGQQFLNIDPILDVVDNILDLDLDDHNSYLLHHRWHQPNNFGTLLPIGTVNPSDANGQSYQSKFPGFAKKIAESNK